MNLNEQERLILYNQYEILKQISTDENDKDYYERNQEILSKGYEHDYDSLFHFEDTPKEISCEVIDILQMFRTLLSSYNNLSNEDKVEISIDDCIFDGFDGNEETVHYAYADWVIKKENLYQEFSHCEMNSHSSRLERYRLMLDKLKDLGKSRYASDLSANDIKYVLGK